MSEPQDRELVERCLLDLEAMQESFRLLYERHAPALARFLRGALSDDDGARDALQETFLCLFRALPRWDPQRPFRPWALGVAWRVAQGQRRAASRRPALRLLPEEDPPARGGPGPGEAAARREEGELLREAVAELPDEERAVFLLRQVEGLTFEEAAEVVGCSPRTAKTRMRGALTLLALGLRRRGLVGGVL